jgi:cytochrome oxidase complex assembly protein 1
MDENPPPIPSVRQPNWFSRNWKWAVPGGCLIVILMGIAFVGAAFFLALGMMKQSDAYKIAFDRAQQNPAVIDALGSPIRAGKFVSGSSHVEGPSGDAKLSIPLSGPKGKGTLYVEATKSAGVWQFAILVVEIEKTGERIDLNQASRSP